MVIAATLTIVLGLVLPSGCSSPSGPSGSASLWASCCPCSCSGSDNGGEDLSARSPTANGRIGPRRVRVIPLRGLHRLHMTVHEAHVAALLCRRCGPPQSGELGEFVVVACRVPNACCRRAGSGSNNRACRLRWRHRHVAVGRVHRHRAAVAEINRGSRLRHARVAKAKLPRAEINVRHVDSSLWRSTTGAPCRGWARWGKRRHWCSIRRSST